MRYFIFFYRCEDKFSHQYGQQGYYSDTLPSFLDIFNMVAESSDYSEEEVNILSYNEVSEEDYYNYFNSRKS